MLSRPTHIKLSASMYGRTTISNSYFRYEFANGSINIDERNVMEIQFEPRKVLSSYDGYKINVFMPLHITVFCPTLGLTSRHFVLSPSYFKFSAIEVSIKNQLFVQVLLFAREQTHCFEDQGAMICEGGVQRERGY